jgi:L-fucono-1,5-lactonase
LIYLSAFKPIASKKPRLMILDTHQHYWRTDRRDYGWLVPELTALYRDFLPEHLQPILQAEGVSQTIAVQAAATTAETEFLLGLADQHDFIAGVVGWLDLDCDDFPKSLAAMRQHPKLVGLRPMIQDLGDDDWILRPTVLHNLIHLEEVRFPIDLLLLPRHLPFALEAMHSVPDLRAVIDHLAKPPIKSGEFDPWASNLQKLSAFPQMHCKLSGLVTEADPQNWTPADLNPYVQHALQCFGDTRLMFGSDWPVCNLVATYAEVIAALRECLGSHFDPGAFERIFSTNGRNFYL